MNEQVRFIFQIIFIMQFHIALAQILFLMNYLIKLKDGNYPLNYQKGLFV